VLALGHHVRHPEAEVVPHVDPFVADQPVDLLDRVLGTRATGVCHALADSRHRQRAAGEHARGRLRQRQDALGMHVAGKHLLQIGVDVIGSELLARLHARLQRFHQGVIIVRDFSQLHDRIELSSRAGNEGIPEGPG